MPGIEPGAFHMQSERATTALHPLPCATNFSMLDLKNFLFYDWWSCFPMDKILEFHIAVFLAKMWW